MAAAEMDPRISDASQKAKALIEALGYIQRFHDKVIVVKVGGSIMDNEASLSTLLADPELFSREPVKFRKATEVLAERQTALETAESEWLDLADRA